MKGNVPRGISLETAMKLMEEGARPSLAVELACRGFCEYYRGDKGESGCGGLAAVKRGVATGKIDTAALLHLTDRPPGVCRRSGCMINEMCSRCSYREGGCDFLSPSPPPDATPCGGYRLLQALLDCGALTPDVLRGLVTGD